MALKKIYIFVEGNDDALFFKRVMADEFLKLYDDVEVIQYAQMKRAKVDLFILSISTLNFKYVITADIDLARSVNDKKKLIKSKFAQVNDENIIIVVEEIESWYLAGMTEELQIEMGLPILESTDHITKEDFNSYYQVAFRSRIDFMQEVLKNYDLATARQKNRSLNWFYENFLRNS